MDIIFSDNAWEDYRYWQQNNQNILAKINLLIKEISIEPYKGIGEIIALRYNWQGYYSRRINMRHRMVYKVQNNKLYIAQCRFHY